MYPAKPPKTTVSPACGRPCECLDGALARTRALEGKVAALQGENRRLKAGLAEAKATIAGLETVRDAQDEHNRALREQLETAEREAHRQAAPFRTPPEKRKPAGEKKRPGRAKGHAGSYRKPPETVDETIEVPLDCCPCCNGPVDDVRPVVQTIEELITMVRRTRLTTYRGRCPQCGEVRSTHPQQVSTATGAAGTHLGWGTLALACELNKRHGVTMRNTCSILRGLGLSLTPGGLSQALDRVADKLEPYVRQVCEGLRHSTVVHADETGWWVGGDSRWLWDYTNGNYTLYRIGSRSSDMVREVLGDDFAGVLVSDCLSSYDPHPGRKSKCVAHHLRAISKAQELAPDSAFLREIELLFKATIELDRAREYDRDFALHVAGARRTLDRLLAGTYLHPAETRIQNRLLKQKAHLLTYLDEPDVDPTNNLAERMLRAAVIFRKLSAGNKTQRGVRTFEILKSLAVTCAQQGRDFGELVAGAMSLGLPPPRTLLKEPQKS